MSGAHARPRHRPARRVWRHVWVSLRRLRPLGTPIVGVWSRLVAAVAEWRKNQFGDDVWAQVDAENPQATSPDPVPAALPAPVEEPQKPVPLVLSPLDVLPVLHGQHPHLPGEHVRWHVYEGHVAGEVYALDVDEVGQRRIVEGYAQVFGAPVTETTDGKHVTVAVMGGFADVTVTVTAVLINDDTMPLPVFEDAAADPTIGDDTLRTQEISERALAEAGVR